MNATQRKIIQIYETVKVRPSQAWIAKQIGVSRAYVNITIKEWIESHKPKSIKL